ncbi:hypothetical protein ScPMuIL_010467 [Solemya velum]
MGDMQTGTTEDKMKKRNYVRFYRDKIVIRLRPDCEVGELGTVRGKRERNGLNVERKEGGVCVSGSVGEIGVEEAGEKENSGKSCTETELGFAVGGVSEIYETCSEGVDEGRVHHFDIVQNGSNSIEGATSGENDYKTSLESGKTEEDDCSSSNEELSSRDVDEQELQSDAWAHHFFPSMARHLAVVCPLTFETMCHLDGSSSRTFVASGVFGSVFLGRLSESGENVAIKEFANGKSSPKDIFREAKALQRLYETGFVPKCHGVARTATGVAIVQEFFGDGTTMHSVLNGKKHSLSRSTLVGICFQLAFALERVHGSGYLLNDLKSDNVLVDCSRPGGAIRFIDMGHAAKKPLRFKIAQEKWHRLHHYSPEVLRGHPTSVMSDVFSLGNLYQRIATKMGIPELGLIAKQCTNPSPEGRPPVVFHDSPSHNYRVTRLWRHVLIHSVRAIFGAVVNRLQTPGSFCKAMN